VQQRLCRRAPCVLPDTGYAPTLRQLLPLLLPLLLVAVRAHTCAHALPVLPWFYPSRSGCPSSCYSGCVQLWWGGWRPAAPAQVAAAAAVAVGCCVWQEVACYIVFEQWQDVLLVCQHHLRHGRQQQA
jgi:hypothetical protein